MCAGALQAAPRAALLRTAWPPRPRERARRQPPRCAWPRQAAIRASLQSLRVSGQRLPLPQTSAGRRSARQRRRKTSRQRIFPLVREIMPPESAGRPRSRAHGHPPRAHSSLDRCPESLPRAHGADCPKRAAEQLERASARARFCKHGYCKAQVTLPIETRACDPPAFEHSAGQSTSTGAF